MADSDPLTKRTEIALRRGVMRLLRGARRPRSLPPDGLDLNGCKFLFVRQDMIGDVLVSTALFALLKERYPGAVVDVLLSVRNASVLDHDPAVRRRWVYRKSPGSILWLLRQLRRERYDFIVDLMDNPSATSTLLLLLAGGKWNVGLQKENAYVYDIAVPLLSRRETHIVERIGRLLVPFGIEALPEELRPKYHVGKEEEGFARSFLARIDVGKKWLIGVNISAGTDVRFWGVDNFQMLMRHIASAHPDAAVLLLYHPAHRTRAQEIQASFANVHLSPATPTFAHFAALVRKLNVLVTPDTSAVHLASAFGIPAVVLYVQSDTSLRIWEPYLVPSECLVTSVDDLRTISPRSVMEAFDRLVQTTRKPHATV